MKDKPKRGFAAMDPERQREIARMGGKKAHEMGRAHEFTPEEASAAGKRSHETGRAHVFTPDEAKVAGRKGGEAAARKTKRKGN